LGETIKGRAMHGRNSGKNRSFASIMQGAERLPKS